MQNAESATYVSIGRKLGDGNDDDDNHDDDVKYIPEHSFFCLTHQKIVLLHHFIQEIKNKISNRVGF